MDTKLAGKTVQFIENNVTYKGVVMGLRCGQFIYVLPEDNSFPRLVPQDQVVIMEDEDE